VFPSRIIKLSRTGSIYLPFLLTVNRRSLEIVLIQERLKGTIQMRTQIKATAATTTTEA
jgi:hypothetical protein